MKLNACTEYTAFTLGEQWSMSPHNCKTLYDASKMFNYLCYRTTNFINLELSLPGSQQNLVLSECEKTQVLLSLKSQRIPVNHCMPSAAEESCSDCKDLLKDHCLQTAALWKKSSLPSEALLFSARHRQQKVLRPILQDKRNMKSLTIKIAMNT